MLILYSPLPQANTGTAAYTIALLAEIESSYGRSVADDVIIAVHSASTEDQFMIAQKRGWKVKDYRAFDRAPIDVCVYFLASNPYHYYCYEQLATHTRGKCVSVIHDLTASFFVREMSMFTGSPYASLIETAFAENHSVRARALIRDFDRIHDVSRYFISAQGVTVGKSDTIITHSYYAKTKLVLDNNLSGASEEKIIVCAHPEPILPEDQASALDVDVGSDCFVVGSFGYYSPSKRFELYCPRLDNFSRSYTGSSG